MAARQGCISPARLVRIVETGIIIIGGESAKLAVDACIKNRIGVLWYIEGSGSRAWQRAEAVADGGEWYCGAACAVLTCRGLEGQFMAKLHASLPLRHLISFPDP